MTQKERPTARGESIHITASQRGGQYADIVEFAHENAGDCGSAVNALALAVRTSAAFVEWSRSRKKRPAQRP